MAPKKIRAAVVSQVYVMGIKTAIAMVAVKPGRAPIIMPTTVPDRVMAR